MGNSLYQAHDGWRGNKKLCLRREGVFGILFTCKNTRRRDLPQFLVIAATLLATRGVTNELHARKESTLDARASTLQETLLHTHYIDATCDSQFPVDVGVPLDLSSFRVGAWELWENNPHGGFHGMLDEVRIFQGSLSA